MSRRLDPLDGTERVLVDGNNLLHAIRRSSAPGPAAALVARIRAAIPLPAQIELIFDGPAERNLRGERIAKDLTVRHSGGRSADELIVASVDAARAATGPAATASILVVTDDRAVGEAVRRLGARTAGAPWLIRRLDRGSSGGGRPGGPEVGLGNRRPSARPPARPSARPPARPLAHPGAGSGAGPGDGPAGADDDAAPGWRPGRGATAKRGNPRRAPRSGRTNRGSPPD
jgi:hypothetical protein